MILYKNFKKCLTGLMVLALLTGGTYVYGWVHANTSETAFNEVDPPDGGAGLDSAAAAVPLRELIINGAAYLLKAGSDINRLSEKIELSDIQEADFYGMYNLTGSAIHHLEAMAEVYRQIVDRANNTPYDDAVTDKLREFHYTAFRNEKRLVKDVFDRVEDYLSVGDVRGVYAKISSDVTGMLNRLYTLRWSLYWGHDPKNETIWDLNMEMAEIHLFGQFVARVFREIQ
ncbi:MAG: hypothetical protein GY940_46955 [bacterium]|nr:hypothetical protein [bacterium]